MEDLRRRMLRNNLDDEGEQLRRDMKHLELETRERDLEEIQNSYQW